MMRSRYWFPMENVLELIEGGSEVRKSFLLHPISPDDQVGIIDQVRWTARNLETRTRHCTRSWPWSVHRTLIFPVIIASALGACRYKKNIKALYIVHPTMFIKTLLILFKPIIRYVPSLNSVKVFIHQLLKPQLQLVSFLNGCLLRNLAVLVFRSSAVL